MAMSSLGGGGVTPKATGAPSSSSLGPIPRNSQAPKLNPKVAGVGNEGGKGQRGFKGDEFGGAVLGTPKRPCPALGGAEAAAATPEPQKDPRKPQKALRKPQKVLRRPQKDLRKLQKDLRKPQKAPRKPQNALREP